MEIELKALDESTLAAGVDIWNQVVEEGLAFPQTDLLTRETGRAFFAGQSYTGAAIDRETGQVVGVYILHPNNVGRCGHLCNASYAVKRGLRGHHLGERLVTDCMEKARSLGYRVLQFNAVVASNAPALKLYARLGFTQLGVIPQGFLNVRGEYEDIIPHYISLV